MAKEKGAAPVAAAAEARPVEAEAERRTFELTRPIKDAEGREIRSLKLVEPELRHNVLAERAHPKSEASQTIHIVAALAGISEEQAAQLVIKDARAVQQWFARLDVGARMRDRFEDGAFEHTFVLSVPVPTDKAPITEIHMRAPDLGTSVVVEKFGHESERLAAVIAQLSGLTIQVAMRIKRRDAARIEAWLGPFVADGSLAAT